MSGQRPLTTSIVMATYNSERFVAAQLASLVEQTCPPDEVIISDDGSSDGTPAIVQQFARTAPMTVHVRINRQRMGYAQNFLTAASLAGGDLLLFCDHDDLWSPEKIEVIRQAAETSDAGLISHDISIFRDDPSKPECESYYQLLRQRELSPAVCFKGCSLAIRSSFVRRWGWPPESSSVSHDFWFALLATGLGERHYVDLPLIQHRIHGQNASGWIASAADRVRTKPGRSYGDAELLIDLCVKRKSLGWTDDFLQALRQDQSAAADELARLLQTNWNWHYTPGRRVNAYCREGLRRAKQFSRRMQSLIGLSRR